MSIIYRIIFALIMAFLWRAGGYGLKPLGKNWRRIVAPLTALLFLLLLHANIWVIILSPIILFIATILPITLIGNDLNKYGQLYWWIPILCMLHSLSTFSWWGIPLWIIQWSMIFCSNKINFPKWDQYEISYGALLGLCIAM